MDSVEALKNKKYLPEYNAWNKCTDQIDHFSFKNFNNQVKLASEAGSTALKLQKWVTGILGLIVIVGMIAVCYYGYV